MRCAWCDARFPANRRSSAPGGFSSPGVFFACNLAASVATVALVARGDLAWAAFAGLVLLVGLGANASSWADARGEPSRDGTRWTAGLSCPTCRRKNTVYPWSW